MIKVPEEEDEEREYTEDDKARMQTAFKWGVPIHLLHGDGDAL